MTLAYPQQAPPDARAQLARIATRYRVDLVPLSNLEQAASRHGSPHPNTLRPPLAEEANGSGADDTKGVLANVASAPPASTPDASEDEVDRNPLARRRRSVRKRHYGLAFLVVLLALIVIVIILDHRSTPCKLQVSGSGGGGTLEQCISASHHHR